MVAPLFLNDMRQEQLGILQDQLSGKTFEKQKQVQREVQALQGLLGWRACVVLSSGVSRIAVEACFMWP